MFNQIYIFMNTTKEAEIKETFVAPTKYYTRSTFDIFKTSKIWSIVLTNGTSEKQCIRIR